MRWQGRAGKEIGREGEEGERERRQGIKKLLLPVYSLRS